mgnify:CR=1 FL=1
MRDFLIYTFIMDKTEQNIHTTTSGMAASSQQTIDLKAMWNKLWQNRKLFFWALPITFVVSCALILCVPRYYECTVVLAPEASTNNMNNFSSLASSFGFNIGRINTNDAIYPSIYPDVINSPDFLINLFEVPVSTIDGTIQCSYFEYLTKYYKRPFWSKVKTSIKDLFMRKSQSSPLLTASLKNQISKTFWLTKKQNNVIQYLQENISCSVNKKNDLICIKVTAQDKYICACIADTVQQHIQRFIIDYRTQKAQNDIVYYQELIEQAKNDYQKASQEYIDYVDSHANLNLQKYQTEADNLQGEMDMKYTVFTSLQKQLITSQAKLQENTPVFTVIQGASVPLQPAGPPRTLFVIGMCMLVTCILVVYILRSDLLIFF